MMAKDMDESKQQPPGTMVAASPPAFTRFGSSWPGAAGGPRPMKPFSEWRSIPLPSGRNWVTRVGMPMPRFTIEFSGSSFAILFAILSLILSSMLFSPFRGFRHLHQGVDENAGEGHFFRVELARAYYFFSLPLPAP